MVDNGARGLNLIRFFERGEEPDDVCRSPLVASLEIVKSVFSRIAGCQGSLAEVAFAVQTFLNICVDAKIWTDL